MIELIIEYFNMHRLVVRRAEDGSGYMWKVSILEDYPADYWLLGSSVRPLPFDDALAAGREELRVWAQDGIAEVQS